MFEETQEVIDERLLGLSGEWMDEQEQGFESDSSDEDISQPGYGPDDIFVENKPFSLKQINDLIDEGDIELSPDFQRNFIWDNTRQSRLIESIFLGLPLPSIYLSQYVDGRLTIVDGLQRIMTIRRFLRNELRLNNLEYITECNGKTAEQLKEVFSPLRLRRFGQTQIMCFVIDYRSPNKLKFDLFRRLNTGGKPLNNQEIRNCLSRPELRQTLKDMVNTEAFKIATDNSVKDSRMEAQEAALRFLCFYQNFNDNDPVDFYNGNMEDTLDNAVETLNNYSGLKAFIPIYEQALKEVKAGRKVTHWIWYIFPQMTGIKGTHSRPALFYGINGRLEVFQYINHPTLRKHLVEICEAVLTNKYSIYEIFGDDVIKVRSCILLFASVSDIPVFKQIKSKYCW